MGLFDGGVPAGLQGMFVQMIKTAAPTLAADVDALAKTVQGFKTQLDRMERKIDALLTAESIDGRQFDDQGNAERTRISGSS